jgi:metallo-beta-lactamase class B
MRRYAGEMRAILTRLVALFLVLTAGCFTFAENPVIPPGLAVPDMEQIAPGVYVKQLAPDVWVDTFIGKADGNPYPANGLILVSGDASVLVDPGWAPDQTKALIAFAKERLKSPAKKAVITHWHEDRAAGIAVLRAAKIETIALDLTAQALAKRSRPVPEHVFTPAELPYADPMGFEIFYPGPGHTPDNIVVYLSKQKVLDGGCFLKAANVKSLGNMEDADVKAWPASLERVAGRYPKATIVIPGHGPTIGDAIASTRALLQSTKK